MNAKTWEERHKHPCIDCGKPCGRQALRCHACAARNRWKLGGLPTSKYGKDSPTWKGGKIINSQGYVCIWLESSDPYFSMAKYKRNKRAGYILEHRLVMAKHLGRCLMPWEVVHHKGTKYPQGSKENKADNGIENLELLPSQAANIAQEKLCRSCPLRKEIRLLRWQMKQLQEELSGKLL